MRSACLASLLIAAPGIALADAPPVPTGDPAIVDKSVPERYRTDVANAQLLGDMLQREDIAAWVASDAMVESGVSKSIKGKQTGWLTGAADTKGMHWVVSFTAKDGEREYSFADVSVVLDKGKPQLRVDIPEGGRDLTPEEKLLEHARELTMQRTDWLRCARTYNYSVMWAEMKSGREIVVKLLPARTDDNAFPFGGFHEFRWATKPGGELKHFSQTNSCLVMSRPPEGAMGFGVTHLTSDTPTQFHVFQSLSYGQPVFVGTSGNGLTWKVEDGRITLLDENLFKEAEPAAEAK